MADTQVEVALIGGGVTLACCLISTIVATFLKPKHDAPAVGAVNADVLVMIDQRDQEIARLHRQLHGERS